MHVCAHSRHQALLPPSPGAGCDSLTYIKAWYSHTETNLQIMSYHLPKYVLTCMNGVCNTWVFHLQLLWPIFFSAVTSATVRTPLKCKLIFEANWTPSGKRMMYYLNINVLAHLSMYQSQSIYKSWWWSHLEQLANTVLTCWVQSLCKSCNSVHWTCAAFTFFSYTFYLQLFLFTWGISE